MEEDDPVVTEDRVPSFDIVAQKIRDIDNTIIIYRVYYLFNTFTYRFQLIKKDRMCIVEIPRHLLEGIGKDGASAEEELVRILREKIEDSECWNEFEG